MGLKNQQPNIKLIEEYNTFHLAHQYDRIAKIWRFAGYLCTTCGKTVQNPNVVPRHHNNCKYRGATVYLQEPNPNQILDKKGDVWQPRYVNVRKSTKHSLK